MRSHHHSCGTSREHARNGSVKRNFPADVIKRMAFHCALSAGWHTQNCGHQTGRQSCQDSTRLPETITTHLLLLRIVLVDADGKANAAPTADLEVRSRSGGKIAVSLKKDIAPCASPQLTTR